MEVEVSGLQTGLILISIRLAVMGYFIGKGLQSFGQPDKGLNYSLF